MNVNVTLDVPGVGKLLDLLKSGIGAIGGPLLAPWQAGRAGQARIAAAKADREVLLLETQAQNEAAMLSAEGRATINQQEMAQQLVDFQNQKRLTNIQSVVEQAAEQVADKEVPDTEVDHDWAARFFNYVQDISSEQMQTLWAKVLAGEVERAGSTSLHALSVLRNLDKSTAEIFELLCSLCISDHKFGLDARVLSLGKPAGENALEPYGLGYRVLNVLNEHGLIVPDYNSWKDYGASAGRGVPEHSIGVWVPFEYQGEYYVLFNDPENPTPIESELRLSGVALTKAGRELRSAVTIRPNEGYASSLRRFLEEDNTSPANARLYLRQVDTGDPVLTNIPTVAD